MTPGFIIVKVNVDCRSLYISELFVNLCGKVVIVLTKISGDVVARPSLGN